MMKYLKFGVLIVAMVTFFTACSKDSDSAEDLLGNWVRMSDFDGVARSEAMSFVIGNKGYICMGYNGKNRLKDLWEYNNDGDFWTQKADFTGTPRSAGVAFSIGSMGYIGTGYDGVNYLNDFWAYDPSANSWSKKADLIVGGDSTLGRNDAVGFALNNYGFIGTGYNERWLKDFYRYDPASDSWRQITSILGSKRMGASSFIIDGKAYVVGGYNNGNYNYDFYMFEPKGDSGVWTKKRDIKDSNKDESYDDNYKIVRAYASAFVINSKGYLTGGNNGSILSDTWEYNPSTDLWVKKSYFEGATRHRAVALTFSDKAIVATGSSSSYRFDDCWKFMPDAESSTND